MRSDYPVNYHLICMLMSTILANISLIPLTSNNDYFSASLAQTIFISKKHHRDHSWNIVSLLSKKKAVINLGFPYDRHVFACYSRSIRCG